MTMNDSRPVEETNGDGDVEASEPQDELGCATVGCAGGFLAVVCGVAAVCAVVWLGTYVGGRIEARMGIPVISWEMAPLAALVFSMPGGIVVALLGLLSGRWWRGLALGLLIQGLYFGCLLLGARGNPFAVNCWFYAVGTIAGGWGGSDPACRKLGKSRPGRSGML
ncbi:MAG: hypothetical protein A2V70_13470 [Planctomycetes bacterium RBG_13_63_9]|nr:MAG: hypothetical protein A2V70_13470 [Planctomycetes bacterium RBG_13_63_9]